MRPVELDKVEGDVVGLIGDQQVDGAEGVEERGADAIGGIHRINSPGCIGH